MLRATGIALALGCLAAPLCAHDNHDPRVDLLVALIASTGCEMTDVTAEEILPAYGFDKQETRAIVAQLLAEGRARIEMPRTALVLSPEECY